MNARERALQALTRDPRYPGVPAWHPGTRAAETAPAPRDEKTTTTKEKTA